MHIVMHMLFLCVHVCVHVFCIIKLVSLNLVVFIPIQAVSLIPKPSLARLDPNDPNMIIGIPDEPVVSMETTTKDGKKVFLKICLYIYLIFMYKNVWTSLPNSITSFGPIHQMSTKGI